MQTSAEIRKRFLDYFKEQGHEVVDSSPLVPANDPTLLFTNAGMVQFKDVFLGLDKRAYTRACSSQRCVRAGGKHNDLENVGYTARHHTFFEMLGNFSFGDYFKREAIHYAWSFLTVVLKLPAEKLWITIYADDDEAADIWLNEIKVDPARFSRIGDKPGGKTNESDNFWSMGDVGPCGPCSEIFYDHGEDVPGGSPGSADDDSDRYIEIWNLVFMQYDRLPEGKLVPLPRPSVDTGMGLERLAAILQGVHSNYDIDLFRNLIKAAGKVTGCKDLTDNSLKVIADHVRACAFLITDEVLPSNEGRGYVLRRIIRRALRHGYQLGQKKLFFYRLVDALVVEMGEAYPELVKAQEQVKRVLKMEEEKFAETLEQGMRILEADIRQMKGVVIPGETVFKLYDTFGFPVDLTADIAREKKLTLDMPGYEKAMDQQREMARSASQFGADYHSQVELAGKTGFSGYEHTDDVASVTALVKEGEQVRELSTGEKGLVVMDRTPFYAESGGQAGDAGYLEVEGSLFRVLDTQKQASGAVIHIGTMEKGGLKVGDTVQARVDQARRQATAMNHTATHLLHAALRSVLGSHVSQKGSLVNADRLRFDFSHFEPVTAEQLQAIESMVNEQIRLNTEVQTRVTDYDTAVAEGAMALFGEKYGDEVRLLKIGDFSAELCGGTHVNRAGDIGLLKITSEGGIASGVRRIEALTGQAAVEFVEQTENSLRQIAQMVKGSPGDAGNKVQQILAKNRKLEKELEQLKSRLASAAGSELSDSAVEVKGVKVLAVRLDGADPKSLRDTVDQLKNKLGSAAVVLAAVNGEKVSLIAGVTKDQTSRLKAGDLVNTVARQVGGKGGGRPDMAQAGGNDPSGLDAALAGVADWVGRQLA
ncbi:MAG TPA: alanine--tRNA ligase [Gammaproteobacteria bacterium]|nr:alanine--tRNA ligase [Gammaproteobacteria bacterium]